MTNLCSEDGNGLVSLKREGVWRKFATTVTNIARGDVGSFAFLRDGQSCRSYWLGTFVLWMALQIAVKTFALRRIFLDAFCSSIRSSSSTWSSVAAGGGTSTSLDISRC